MTESDQEARLRQALLAERDDLPGTVRDRLAASRREAVALMEKQETASGGWSLADLLASRGLAMAAAASAAAIALWIGLSSPEDPALPLISVPEVAVVEDLEMLEELEFLAWLEEESQGAG